MQATAPMHSLENFLCIDFEASALAPGSYPIELGAADPATGACRSWLIRPSPEWQIGGLWTAQAESTHHITRARLAEAGLPPVQVITEFTGFAQGRTLLSDNPSFDWNWLEKLAEVADRRDLLEHTGVTDIADLITELAAGRDPTQAWDDAMRQAVARHFTHPHRAGPDARQLAEALRILAG